MTSLRFSLLALRTPQNSRNLREDWITMTSDFTVPLLVNELAKNLLKKGDGTKRIRGNRRQEEDGPAGFGVLGKTQVTRKLLMIRSPPAR